MPTPIVEDAGDPTPESEEPAMPPAHVRCPPGRHPNRSQACASGISTTATSSRRPLADLKIVEGSQIREPNIA